MKFSDTEIHKLFPRQIENLDCIGKICHSCDDEEALENCSEFVGVPWTDVTPQMWRKRFTGVSFFYRVGFLLFHSFFNEMFTG